MESLNGIIGARIDSELSVKIKQHICKYPQINGAYDLILHRYGQERIIGSVHVEVADDMTAKEVLQMHGFYVDSEKMEVSFDLIIDFNSDRKLQIRDEIVKSVSGTFPQYRFHVILDNDFSD